MKVVHFADAHIGASTGHGIDSATGLNTRVADYLRCFDEIVDYAIESDVDLVLFAGDMYQTRNPSQTLQKEVTNRIVRLAEAQIPLVLLEGNHDQQKAFGKASSLHIFGVIHGVYVAVEPDVFEIETKSGMVRVVCLPYPAKYDIDEALETLSLTTDMPTICLAHVTVVDAVPGSEVHMALDAEDAVFRSKFDGFDYVALGHVHRHQSLGNMVYSGSIERSGFYEPESKGFVVVTIEDDVRWEFVPIRAREYLEVSGDTLEEIAGKLPADLSNTIIRVRAQEGIDVSGLRKLFVGAHKLESIIIEQPRHDRRPESVGVESLELDELMDRYFDSKGFDKDYKDKLFAAFEEMRECQDIEIVP